MPCYAQWVTARFGSENVALDAGQAVAVNCAAFILQMSDVAWSISMAALRLC